MREGALGITLSPDLKESVSESPLSKHVFIWDPGPKLSNCNLFMNQDTTDKLDLET